MIQVISKASRLSYLTTLKELSFLLKYDIYIYYIYFYFSDLFNDYNRDGIGPGFHQDEPPKIPSFGLGPGREFL